MRFFKLFSCFALIALVLNGCGEPTKKRYVKFLGGGLTFNYRYSRATMVAVAKVVSPMNEGSTIQVLFQIPGETERQKIVAPIVQNQLTYKIESKPLTGIKKDQPLSVDIIAIDEKGVELDRVTTTFTSDLDQDSLPTKPLTDPNTPAYIPQLENLN